MVTILHEGHDSDSASRWRRPFATGRSKNVGSPGTERPMRWTLYFSAFLTIACRPGPEPPREGTEAISSQVVEGRVDSADGVSIAYDARGSGDTALVFVHCWACDRSFWRGQVDAFSDPYRVVTLDLAGHGDSGADRETWSPKQLAEDVRAVVSALDLERVILVGHSLGGPVSLEAARLMPGRVDAVVCVDTLHDVTFEFPEEAAEQMMAGLENDYEGSMRGFITSAMSGADPEVVDFVIERALAADREAVLGIAETFRQFVLKDALSAVDVPVRCINAEPNPPMVPETNVAANREHADFDAVILEDVGHFLHLEKPEAFNEVFREVLAGLDSSR